MYRILIVDDERALADIIAQMLKGCGYDTCTAYDADQAYDMLSKGHFDLLILDINLPGMTGFELCKDLRQVSGVPVIFASARTNETDRITSFDIGGDDYIQKPYSMKELLSRVNALIRRAYGGSLEQEKIAFGDVSVDLSAHVVTRGGERVNLASREFDLLKYLCQNKNTVIPKEKLMTEVWGAFSESEASSLTVHIRWLREKLEEDPSHPKYIKTVWRMGYMLEVNE